MIPCDDIPRLLECFKRDPVRYRHIVHELDPPCPEWDVAMRCCDYVDRVGFVLRERPRELERAVTYHVNSLDDMSLVVRQSGRSARVEGRLNRQTCEDFVHWCRNGSIEIVETWNESLRDGLTAEAGLGPWNTDGAEYTTGTEEFRASPDARVRRLTCEDEGIWRRFADRNADDPMVNARPGSQAVIRDFVFMCKGLPVDYYAAVEDGEITGVAGVNPMTRTVDEIGMLFVDPRHRRKGFGRGLLTAATQDILARGHAPAYGAAGSPQQRPDLHALLLGIGYHLVACPWRCQW